MRATPTPRTRPHTTPPAPASTARRWGQARRAAAELAPHVVEQIAQRVAQLLHEHRHEQDARPAPARLLDATQLARHLGVTRTWVYEHAQQLGAIRLGTGAKARLRFDLDTATAALKSLHEPTPGGTAIADGLAAGGAPRRGRPRRRPQPTAPLLPIHEPKARGIRARLTRIGRGR